MQNLNLFSRIPFLLLLLVLFGCNPHSAEETSISGCISDASNAMLYLFKVLPDSIPLLDSTKTDEHGNFIFSVFPEETSFYLLRLGQSKSITLAAGKGEKIVMKGSGKDLLHTYTIVGSDESSVLWKFNSMAIQNQEKVDSLSRVLNESQSLQEFPAIRKELDSAYKAIYDLNRKQTLSFLSQHTASLASVIILNRTFGGTPVVTPENDLQLFTIIDSALQAKYHNNRNYFAFHKTISQFRSNPGNGVKDKGSLAIGSPGPEIILPEAGGKLKKLSSLRGKIVLIYFWASWNSSCREMNMGLSGLYEQFHARGFDIYGVSLDTDQTSWLVAARRDRANWIQVNDSSGFKSANAVRYRIRSLPAAILLDRDGKVISGDIKLPELKALLLEKL
jgi:peroxiredoxin